jgi:hypothetical protein
MLLNASAAGGDLAQAALVKVLHSMSLDVPIEASLLKAFVPKKLTAGVQQLDPAVARALRSSLTALERAAQSRRRWLPPALQESIAGTLASNHLPSQESSP